MCGVTRRRLLSSCLQRDLMQGEKTLVLASQESHPGVVSSDQLQVGPTWCLLVVITN